MSRPNIEYRKVGPPPAERLRPMALIALCSACDSREVGHAYYDGAALVWATVPVPVTSPPPTAPEGTTARRHEDRRRAQQGDAIGAAKSAGRRWEAGTSGVVRVLTTAAHVRSTCPVHGELEPFEVDPGQLSRTRTLRIPARAHTIG